MSVTARSYDHAEDLNMVKEFLYKTFLQKDSYQLWIPTRFENSVFYDEDRSTNVHLWLDSKSYEDSNSQFMVGISILDHPDNFILITHPRYKYLIEKMVLWAEHQLKKQDLIQFITYSVKEDTIQNAKLSQLGYEVSGVAEHTRKKSKNSENLDYRPPNGFHIKSISKDNYDNYVKSVEIVFQHPHFTHEVFDDMRKAHFYNEDLNLGAFTDDGILAAFCMLRIDEFKIAEFEPVGTLPEFRNQGLAHALMCECISRAKEFDPLLYYVGGAPTEEADRLYESLGFQDKTEIYRWVKKNN